jgi:hypothetical protein
VGGGERFDALTRLFAGSMSRRQAMKLALGGTLGTVGVLALQQGTAIAECDAAACAATGGTCCPATTFGAAFCSPAGTTCCGALACTDTLQICCPGTSPFTGTRLAAPFCATVPGFVSPVCCGAVSCQPPDQKCVQGPGDTTCCLPASAPAGTTCCGNLPNGCAPGQACQEYPPGTFTCIPVVS